MGAHARVPAPALALGAPFGARHRHCFGAPDDRPLRWQSTMLLLSWAPKVACKEGTTALQGWHGTMHCTSQTLGRQPESLSVYVQADEAGASLNMHSGQRQLYKDGMSRSSPAISTGAAPQTHHRQAGLHLVVLPAQSTS